MWIGLAVVSFATLAGCGGSSASVEEDSEFTTTTSRTSEQTPLSTTSTVAATETLSRDALVALRRCLDQPSLPLPFTVLLDGPEVLVTPIEVCEEALVQVRVDYSRDGGVVGDLVAALDSYTTALNDMYLDAKSGDFRDMDDANAYSSSINASWPTINRIYFELTGG